MKIKLSEIHPAPQPVRTTWDEDKLDELAQSIKEQGLIMPIKVRPNGNGYEVVYGNRRVEAARRAGLAELESIVEGIDDTDALIQALIENVQREDMTLEDKGRAYRRIVKLKQEQGYRYSNHTLVREGVAPNWMEVQRAIAFLDEPEEVKELYRTEHKIVRTGQNYVKPRIGQTHIEELRHAGVPENERRPILEKARDEELSYKQMREVAESILTTKDPRRRRMLLETPYSSFIHDPDMNRERAERYGAHDPLSQSKEPSTGEMWEMTMEVKMILDYLKSSRKMAQEAIAMDEMGKFSPEARLFVARKARLMVKAWQGVVDKLGAEP